MCQPVDEVLDILRPLRCEVVLLADVRSEVVQLHGLQVPRLAPETVHDQLEVAHDDGRLRALDDGTTGDAATASGNVHRDLGPRGGAAAGNERVPDVEAVQWEVRVRRRAGEPRQCRQPVRAVEEPPVRRSSGQPAVVNEGGGADTSLEDPVLPPRQRVVAATTAAVWRLAASRRWPRCCHAAALQGLNLVIALPDCLPEGCAVVRGENDHRRLQLPRAFKGSDQLPNSIVHGRHHSRPLPLAAPEVGVALEEALGHLQRRVHALEGQVQKPGRVGCAMPGDKLRRCSAKQDGGVGALVTRLGPGVVPVPIHAAAPHVGEIILPAQVVAVLLVETPSHWQRPVLIEAQVPFAEGCRAVPDSL
mmetsp:Transcript_141562/g.394554  ORF Transcript_141562/g.394554 Transcript_141562/m.394554 type:complete len:362 (-) Transcript_141562:406-1491(-)